MASAARQFYPHDVNLVSETTTPDDSSEMTTRPVFYSCSCGWRSPISEAGVTTELKSSLQSHLLEIHQQIFSAMRIRLESTNQSR